MRLRGALLGSELAHHLHRGRVPVVGGDGAVRRAPVAAARGRDPDEQPALLEQPLHLLHGVEVLLHLRRLERRVVVHVFLGVHAEQVLAHGEGLAQQVGHHSVARDVGDLLAEARVRHLGEQRDERGVPLGLVVAEHDDVVARGELLLYLRPALGVAEDGAVELDERADVRVRHLVVVEGFSDGEVMGRELERCADDLSGVRGEHVLEDGGERASGALLVALEGEQHLLLVRGDEAVEGGLELGREEAADPSESALVGEEGDDELGGAHLEVLEGILLGGLNGGAGDDAAAASGNGAALSTDGGRGRRSGSDSISSVFSSR